MSPLELLSAVADILIILLLAIQSFVLWKLKNPIINTAKNSEGIKKLFSISETLGSGKTDVYPDELKRAGINNCQHWEEKNHIHIQECF